MGMECSQVFRVSGLQGRRQINRTTEAPSGDAHQWWRRQCSHCYGGKRSFPPQRSLASRSFQRNLLSSSASPMWGIPQIAMSLRRGDSALSSQRTQEQEVVGISLHAFSFVPYVVSVHKYLYMAVLAYLGACSSITTHVRGLSSTAVHITVIDCMKARVTLRLSLARTLSYPMMARVGTPSVGDMPADENKASFLVACLTSRLRVHTGQSVCDTAALELWAR